MPAIIEDVALIRLIFSMAPFTPLIRPEVSAVIETDAFKSDAMVQFYVVVVV
jgi:hypothetical protein